MYLTSLKAHTVPTCLLEGFKAQLQAGWIVVTTKRMLGDRLLVTIGKRYVRGE